MGAYLKRHCPVAIVDYDGVPVARLIQFCEPHLTGEESDE